MGQFQTNCQNMRGAVLLLLPALALGVPYPPQCRFIDSMPFFRSSARTTATHTQEVEMLTEFARFAQSRVPVLLSEFARYRQILDTEPQALLRSITRMPKARLFDDARADTTDPTTEALTGATTELPTDTTMDATTESPTDAPTGAPTEAPTTEANSDNEVEREVQEAIETIVTVIKETFESLGKKTLSLDTIAQIGTGVILGVKEVFLTLGLDLPAELPDLPNLIPDISIPDIEFPDIDLPDLDLSDILPDLDFSLSSWPLVCKAIWWPYDDDYCQAVRCSACSPAMIAAARVCEVSQGSVNHFCLRKVLGDGGCNYCAIDFLANHNY